MNFVLFVGDIRLHTVHVKTFHWIHCFSCESQKEKTMIM